MVNESNDLDLSQMICHNLLGNEMKKIMIIYILYPNWIPKIMGVLKINIVKEHWEEQGRIKMMLEKYHMQ